MRVLRKRCVSAAMMAALATISVAARTHPELKTEPRVDTKPIPFQVTYEISREVVAGRLQVTQKGKDGELIDTYSVSLKGGKPVSKTLVSSQKVEPTNEVILVGKPGFETSRHYFTRGRAVSMSATGYDASPQTIPGTHGRTATGLRAAYGVIAVDPRVIPMGSIVYVEGYGLAIAADKGSAIKGHRIDLCFDSRSTALHFGRHNVRLYMLHGE